MDASSLAALLAGSLGRLEKVKAALPKSPQQTLYTPSLGICLLSTTGFLQGEQCPEQWRKGVPVTGLLQFSLVKCFADLLLCNYFSGKIVSPGPLPREESVSQAINISELACLKSSPSVTSLALTLQNVTYSSPFILPFRCTDRILMFLGAAKNTYLPRLPLTAGSSSGRNKRNERILGKLLFYFFFPQRRQTGLASAYLFFTFFYLNMMSRGREALL